MHIDGAECVKKHTKPKLSVRRVFRLPRSVIPSQSLIRFQKRKVLKSETLNFWREGVVGTEGVEEVYKKFWRLLRPCFLWSYFCRSCLKIFCTVLFYQCVLKSLGWLISQCVFCLRARVWVCACECVWVCVWERDKQGPAVQTCGVCVLTEALLSLLASCFASFLVPT